MKHKEYKIVLFIAFGFLFLLCDVFIGHFSSHMHNPMMWVPIIFLPFGIIISVANALSSTKTIRTVFFIICLVSCVIGLLGCTLHVLRFTQNLQGQMGWETIVRLMRYPPIFAPLSLTGLGVLGIMINKRN